MTTALGPGASVAVVPFSGDPGDAIKLFAAALSWHLKEGEPGTRLRYVMVSEDGEGEEDQKARETAAYALGTLHCKGVEVAIEIDFELFRGGASSDLSDSRWVRRMLERPSAPKVGSEFRADGFRWYRTVSGSRWSGRIKGLEVCTRGGDGRWTFRLGKGNKESAEQDWFRRNCLFPPGKLSGLGDEDALKVLGNLVCSNPRVQLEHRLESALLDRQTRIEVDGKPLDPILPADAAPFQFPARWWPRGRARYIDVMMRSGREPWIVELKVDQGQGGHFREGLVQVALYREYITSAPGLDPWFANFGLNRESVRALAVFPMLRGHDGDGLKEDHAAVAAALDVEIHWLPPSFAPPPP